MKLTLHQPFLFIVIALSVLAGISFWGMDSTDNFGNKQAKEQSNDPLSGIKSKNSESKNISDNSSQIQLAQSSEKTTSGSLLVASAIRLLENSSIRSKVRQRGYLFEKELNAEGSYLQADGGAGGVKLELIVKTKNRKIQLRTFNDGVYYFRQLNLLSKPLNSIAKHNRPSTDTKYRIERINLRKVSSRVDRNDVWGGHWISYGGLYLFMEQLERSFQFAEATESKVSGDNVLISRGVWKPERLAYLLPSQKESILASGTLNMNLVPRQIPFEVEVYFLADGPLKDFPIRIVFFRPSDEILEGIKLMPVLVTEFTQPELIDTPAASEFQFNAEENEVFDVTDEFIQTFASK